MLLTMNPHNDGHDAMFLTHKNETGAGGDAACSDQQPRRRAHPGQVCKAVSALECSRSL